MFPISSINKWVYVAVTYNGASCTLYLDGVVSTPSTGFTCKCANNEGVLILGQEQDSLGGGFVASQASNTHQDTIAVYSRVWSAGEVAAFPSCINAEDGSLYALWRGGGDGTDLSGNGWKATVTTSGTVDGYSCNVE
jgi:hypothetical protein